MLKTYTIDELLNEYYNIAKEQFELNNIKISKTGVIGYLLYILGYIKKDSEYYYNYLYKELLPLTAQEYSSLLLHAALFGYQPLFANPATYKGNIQIYLPKIDNSNIVSRTITIPKGTTFNINNLIWTLDAELTIHRSLHNNYAVYNSKEGIKKVPIVIKTDPINADIEYIELDLLYLKQYIFNQIEFTMPYYDYGVYYRYELNIDDGYLADIDIYVKTPDTDEFTKFDISFTKFGYSDTDNVVFISQTSEKSYVLEFGNGIIGRYIPQNSEIQIKYKITKGSNANFYNGELVLLDQITVIEKRIDNTYNTYTIGKDAVKGQVLNPITDGRDIETPEELRSNILKYIRTRNNLVKFDDYKILFSSLFNYEFLFKKINFVDNDIYIYGALYNPYYQPYKTISITLKESEFNPSNSKYIYKFRYTYQKQNKIPYPFPEEVYTTQTISNTNIVPVNDITKFHKNQEIVFNNDITNVYTVTDINSDDNTITLDKKIDNLPKNTPIQYLDYERVNLISPFLYKKNDLLNTYDGYLILTEDIYMDIIYADQNNIVPNIIFKITFDDDFNNVNFSIIPYDNTDLSAYNFQLTIPELNIYNVILNDTNKYTYAISITDDIFNILLNGITIDINVYLSDVKIAEYKKESHTFIFNLADLLRLKKFIDSTSGDTYIIQIPMISEDEYNVDPLYIQSKIKSLLVNTELSENRLPSVQHSFRFYNTLELYPTQKYLKEDIPTDYINLPLQLKLYVVFDKQQLSQSNISINDYIEQIKLDLAKYLTDNYTTTKIEFYTSKIEDFVHNYKYVKYVKVLSPEYNIIVNDFDKILSSYTDKLDVAKFNPVLFWWDVNNIDIVYVIE